jgi:hypothetical protein
MPVPGLADFYGFDAPGPPKHQLHAHRLRQLLQVVADGGADWGKARLTGALVTNECRIMRTAADWTLIGNGRITMLA